MKLVFATNNKHKLQELRQIVGNRFEILSLADIGCDADIPETGTTLDENALIKARYVKQLYGYDCFADDTGLEVEALDGAPGVYSARYAQMCGAVARGHDSEANMRVLLDKLKGKDNRHARFRTAIALIVGSDTHMFEGTVHGEILEQRAGEGGFGYDPVFKPDGWDITFAEATPEQKNAVSHRGRATAKLVDYLLGALMLAVMMLLPPCRLSANAKGWYKYPVYSDGIDCVATTPCNVYYRSGASLYAYNTVDDETVAYTSAGQLSGAEVRDIYANYDGGYLVVAYADGNLDVIYDDGRVVNLPEIRDAGQIGGQKTINDVAFGRGLMAVATNFGIVIYDTAKMEVRQSGIYGAPVQAVAIAGDYLCISGAAGTDAEGLRVAPLGERLVSLASYSHIGRYDIRCMQAVSDDALLYVANSPYRLGIICIDFASMRQVGHTPSDFLLYKPYIGQYRRGWYAVSGSDLLLWKEGRLHAVKLPAELKGQYLALAEDEKEVWAADDHGIGCYDISGESPRVICQKMIPADAVTCRRPGYMRWSPDGRRLYISNIESSAYKSYARGEAKDAYQTTNVIEDGFARDVSLREASADLDFTRGYQQLHGNRRMYGDATWIVQDPDDSDIYYCGNSHEGLYVCSYDEASGAYVEAGKVTHANAPFSAQHAGSTRVQDVNIDPAGNLWVGALGAPYYAVLPSDKRRAGVADASFADWIAYDRLKNVDMDQKEFFSLFCKKSRMLFLFSGKWEMGIVAIDTKGTYSDPTDDDIAHITSFTDQDGIEFPAPQRTTFAIEDVRGCVWIGTSSGVFEITDPARAVSPDLHVRRIKVPRNDGTLLADYLLDGEMVNWMTVDHADRKWIATDNSGLYLVSPTGDRILCHYDSDNSPLGGMTVCTVECDPRSNRVYAGTPDGLYSFFSDSAPAAADYAGILAYPNPVRPEYDGDVTIKGLMDNSIVNICDAAGHVVYRTRSEGGMAQWPCRAGGGRAKSGVYYVLVANPDGNETAVTKILVIN